jgi:predicted transcriptional regulator
MLVGLFVWIGAVQEASFTQMKSALGGIPVGRAMVTKFETLDANEPLSRAIDYVLEGFQQDFPVVENGQLAGVLRHGDIAAAISKHGTQVRVGEVMRRDISAVSPRAMLEYAYGRLQQGECTTMPVVENGQLVGLLTCDNVTEVLMIQEAMRAARSRKPGAAGRFADETPIQVQPTRRAAT